MSAGEGSAAMRRLSSRSSTRSSLPESLDEQKRVEKVLREAGRVAHETVVRNGDGVSCFFFSFLDGWRHAGNTVMHEDTNELRRAGKKWMLDNYSTLLAKGVIEQWTHDYPTLSAHMQINNTHGCNTAMVTHSLVT
jgi:hypothetical protein